MSIVISFEIALVLLVVLAVVLTLYWLSQRPFHVPLPSPFCERDSHEDEWRQRYDDELLMLADGVLLMVCDAFCFNPDERYKLQPDDQLMDIYRGRYPPRKKWPRADCMEMETLMYTLNKEYMTESFQWHPDITLGQLVDLAVKQHIINGEGTI